MTPFEIVFSGNKKVDVNFENFTVKTDQAVKNDGDGSAPEPFALFFASIGACAGIYAKRFCDTREIDTTGMKLELVPTIKQGLPHIEKIELTLHVNQAFPEKYIKAVIKAMNACTVKKQLHPDILTDTRVAYLED